MDNKNTSVLSTIDNKSKLYNTGKEEFKGFDCKCGQKDKPDNAYKCRTCQTYSCTKCELIIVDSIIRCPNCKEYIAHK